MEEFLLTDEEIKRAAYKYNELYKGGIFEHTRRPDADESIAEAQAKKLLKAISKKAKRFDGTEYLVPDYSKFKEAIESLGVK